MVEGCGGIRFIVHGSQEAEQEGAALFFLNSSRSIYVSRCKQRFLQ